MAAARSEDTEPSDRTDHDPHNACQTWLNNDGQELPARRYFYTFANRLVRTNVATQQPICGYIFQLVIV